MKKSVFSFIMIMCFTIFSFASNPKNIVYKNDNIKTEQKANSISKTEKVCTITCSTTYNGVTYTTTAGNWFTSCRTASAKCLDKLAYMWY